MLRAALQQRQRGAVGHHGLPALDQALLRSTIASVCPLSLLGTPRTPLDPQKLLPFRIFNTILLCNFWGHSIIRNLSKFMANI